MASHLLAVAGRHVLQSSRSGAALRIVPCAYSSQGNFCEKLIGNRDVVGFGINGLEIYLDRQDYPMPAIRWKENTPDVLALREKEKGDWKQLSMEDKKALYRASFCQTYAEMNAPTGKWKTILAGVLAGLAISLWFTVWTNVYVFPPPVSSLSPESREAQLRRMLALEVDIVEGLSSKWDYEKGTWKK